jgi:radical SAM protein with 4Fe4S-binding SPASM domain
MKIKEKEDYADQLQRKMLRGGRAVGGQIDLTYLCNLKCQHCFIAQEKDKKELAFEEIISIINKIHKAGCLWLSFSGGEVFLREDFLDIYAYARKKGFLISILTNGTLITEHIVDYLADLSPFCIDITLNGITQKVYEEVTQVKGSFAQVMQAIDLLTERSLPLTLKTNGMKINRDEILEIKHFSEELLGKNRFRLDLALCAGMDGSKKPCKLRLTPDEILSIQNADREMLFLCRDQFLHQKHNERLKRGFLFPCGLSSFHIDPYGQMRLCLFIKEPCADLSKDSFPESFQRLYAYFQCLRATVDTKCRGCKIEYLCRQCPGRALIENGDMEQPVDFFCQLAHCQEENKDKFLN